MDNRFLLIYKMHDYNRKERIKIKIFRMYAYV